VSDMQLSASELRGPWLFILECGHNTGSAAKARPRRKCQVCGGEVRAVVSAYYGKKAIPFDILKGQLAAVTTTQTRPKKRRAADRGEHHRDFRASLIRDGWDEVSADRAAMEYRWNGLRGRAGDERYRRIRERLDGPRVPNDKRYKPTTVDPLLKGVARATGETARAIRSGRTITDWQYAEREQRA
jgi:hypothetical protein